MIRTIRICDMGGEGGTHKGEREGQAESFGLDGQEWQIDLCGKDAERFYATMTYWAHVARKAGTGRPVISGSGVRVPAGRGSRPRRQRAATLAANAKVRAWAKAQGITVGDRGRIPEFVQRRYAAEHAAAAG